LLDIINMATYLKYVVDIYFEELSIKHNYDKYLLQKMWDESNTVMKDMLHDYVDKEYPAISDEKTNAKTCCHVTKKKGEQVECTNKVAGPNRKTCYRHTPELQTIIKKKIDVPKTTCVFVPQKGKFKGIKCGVETDGAELCSQHTGASS